MGAAAVMGGAMDNLMAGNGSNAVQDATRRASAPGSNTGGGFSSIFNLKSVISAATKSPQNPPQPATAPSASNFYVAPPPAATEPINVEMHSHSNASLPQKSVQGIVLSMEASVLSTCFLWLGDFLFFVGILMKYCFN